MKKGFVIGTLALLLVSVGVKAQDVSVNYNHNQAVPTTAQSISLCRDWDPW